MTIHDDFKSKGPDLLVDLASHVAATLSASCPYLSHSPSAFLLLE